MRVFCTPIHRLMPFVIKFGRVEHIFAKRQCWFLLVLEGKASSNEPTYANGIRVGMRFEGIKRMVNGLLDMQRFLSRVSKASVELVFLPKLVPYIPFPQIPIFIL